MKKSWLILIVLFGMFQNRDHIYRLFNPPEPLPDSLQKGVVLFSTPQCGYCAQARQLLDTQKIPYQELDISASKVHYQYFNSVGGQGVPVLLVNGKVFHGYNESVYKNALLQKQ